MSGPYDNIREGAMNPPAGAAAGYEDMLWNQMLGASQQEEQRYLQSLRDTSNRAIDRSGWYNVGSMLMPHDVGDVALSAAMGPGLGRGMRTALAALGGLTTQVGDAEAGLFTLPQWMRAARAGISASAGRNQIEERMASLEPALRNMRGADAGPLRNPGQYSGDEINRAFENVSVPTFTDYGWLPMPDPQRNFTDMLGAATGNRFTWPTGNIMSGFRVGQAARPLESELTDELLYAAAPGMRDVRLSYGGLPAGLEAAYLGRMNDQPGSIFMRPGQSSPTMAETLYHETQHGLQDLTGRARGGTSRTVAENNPDMYERYFSNHAGLGFGPTAIEQATRAEMYNRLPGEWEARLGGKLSANRQSQLDGMTMEELLGESMPDFNLRGVAR